MLASVLKSQIAVRASIAVVRAFVRLREVLATHGDLAEKIASLEKKYDSQQGGLRRNSRADATHARGASTTKENRLHRRRAELASAGHPLSVAAQPHDVFHQPQSGAVTGRQDRLGMKL